MLEDFRLKVFMEVARQKSFTKAAAALGVTQPAISQNIAELEKGLGVRLFDRLKGETVLTPEGEVFSSYAEKLLSTAASASNMLAKLSPATVKISASEELYTYIISPALEKFSSIHPEITFERCLFGDADLTLKLKPSTGSPYDIPADSIARIRMSIYPTPKLGDLSATQEKTSYFEVLYQPSQTFACTRLCRLIKELIIT
jgi:hypothetical protein